MFMATKRFMRFTAYGVTMLALFAAFAAPIRAAERTPLIPRDVLFGNPERAGVQLSPDGKYISFLAPVNGVLNVWVGPADKPDDAKPVTKDTHRGIRRYFWAYTNNHVLYVQDKDGDENWHVYSVNLKNNEITDLTPYKEVHCQVLEVSHEIPNEILVGINDRDPRMLDVYRVNINNAQRKLVVQNDEGFVGFITDDDLNVYFATKSRPDGSMEVMRRMNDDWKSFATIPVEDAMTTQPIALDKTRKKLYWIDSRGRNTAALMIADIEGGKSEILFENSRADVSGAEVHPTEKKVQAVSSTFERVQWKILDKAIEKDFEALRKVADGDFSISTRTLDDAKWVVAYVMDTGPVRYYLYDRESKKAKFLFTNRKQLEQVTLAPMHPVTIKSRDGLNLVSYYTLPPWTDSDKDGKPNEALPMVLFVHGGPWARDNWGLNSYHQWLANRGYAVLSVNYRGSTGFGKDFINASTFEWAGKMHDDLIDAVNWAVKQGIAEKDKVAIMGGSYGGYATLVGLTFTPDTFACGVDIVGPSNLITLLNTIPPYWAPMIELFTKRVGDHRTDDGRKLLAERSPLNRVDKIKKPLLIGQGANDPRVKQSESDQIVEAMKKKNIPVTYVLYPDEGHGFARPENRMSFNAVAEVFLAENIGGRYEPMGDEMSSSSIMVPEGAAHVPGLSKLIKTSDTKSNDPT
jgi:dipeptidyl aminopeptidase/acylaminoacyl peptidase